MGGPLLLVAFAFAAPTVAVAPFQDHTGDPSLAALGAGLADMVVTDLCAAASCVERSRVDEIFDELALASTGWLEPATAQRLGRGVGASHVVFGALSAQGDTLRMDGRLVEVQSGRVAATVRREGPRADAFALESGLAEDLLEALSVPWVAREPVSTASITAYGRALQAADDGKEGLARTLLAGLVASDPHMVWASSRLAELDVMLRSAAGFRSDALNRELLALVDDMAAGDASACDGFQARFWTRVQPITMGGRAMSFVDPAVTLPLWRSAGLPSAPVDRRAFGLGVGRALHDAWGVALALEGKSIPDEICPGRNPNEVALGGMLVALGAAREGAALSDPIAMIGPDGKVAMGPDALDDLLLELADRYVRRFPTGSQVTMLHFVVGPAAERVSARP